MLHAPQLITDARMLFIVWIPADPAAAARLLPDGLTGADGYPVYMNQYVVDDENQTSAAGDPDGFGAYSLTYLGVELAGLDTEAGTPGRFWTHYFDSSPNMIDYAAARGVPAREGQTTLELGGGKLVATTVVGGTPVIRSTARVDVGTPLGATGQLRYVTRVGGELVSGRYPFVAKVAETLRGRVGRVSRRVASRVHPPSGRPARDHVRLLLAGDLVLLSGRGRATRLRAGVVGPGSPTGPY